MITNAAAMSTVRMLLSSLVYGSHTIRLSAVTVDSSSGVRSVGNHAWSGWRAASVVNGAISRPSHTRCSSSVRPARAAIADSKIGYTSCGQCSPAPISIALNPGRASPRVSS